MHGVGKHGQRVIVGRGELTAGRVRTRLIGPAPQPHSLRDVAVDEDVPGFGDGEDGLGHAGVCAPDPEHLCSVGQRLEGYECTRRKRTLGACPFAEVWKKSGSASRTAAAHWELAVKRRARLASMSRVRGSRDVYSYRERPGVFMPSSGAAESHTVMGCPLKARGTTSRAHSSFRPRHTGAPVLRRPPWPPHSALLLVLAFAVQVAVPPLGVMLCRNLERAPR